MKKLMIAAATAAVGAGVYAASLDAQVYDVNLTVKSTTCKEIKYTKTIATLEGEHYSDVKGEKLAVRKQASTKIAGVIWGCECETIADPAWRLYNNGTTIGGYLFWNVGGEHLFNIFTTSFRWAVLNRIDTGDKAEGVWLLTNSDADNTVAFLGAGFGKVSGLTCRTVVKSMSGNFAGFLLAGSDAGGCKFCGGNTCDAWQVCPCTDADGVYDLKLTAAYGTWKIKYNSSASKKLKKTGLITKAYNFKKAGDTATIFAKVEKAAAKGLLATDDEDSYWEDGKGIFDFEDSFDGEFGEKIDAARVGAVAYESADGEADGEEPDTFDGENAVVKLLLDLEDEEDAS
jgi:hypothetical protein